MADFLLDTDTASRVIRQHRATIRGLRRSSASSVGISAVTRSELLYGAHIAPYLTGLMGSVRTFVQSVDEFDWTENAAEHHALVRAEATMRGRSAGPFDIMIAAHALALGRTLVTSDQAIHNLGIKGLKLADWST